MNSPLDKIINLMKKGEVNSTISQSLDAERKIRNLRKNMHTGFFDPRKHDVAPRLAESEVDKLVKNKLMSDKQVRLQDKIMGGAGGAYGGLLGGAIAYGSAKPEIGRLAKLLRVGTGAGIGGLGVGGAFYGLSKLTHREYDKLTPEQKREHVREYIANQDKKDSHPFAKFIRAHQKANELAGAGGLLGLGTNFAAAKAMMLGLKGLDKADDKTVEELLQNSGVGKNVNFLGIGKGKGVANNAHFQDVKPYINEAGNEIIGNVDVSHENMYKPGIIAHELGHANISKNKGFVGALQKYLYPATSKLQGPIGAASALGIYGATKDDTDVGTGAAKGLGIASAANAGILIPEFEASRRGAANILKSSLRGRSKASNIASMLPAFLTYLAATGGVGAGIGATNAYYNKKQKAKDMKKRPKEKKAAMFQGRDIPQHILDAIRSGNKAVLSRGGKAIRKKKPSAVIPPVKPLPANTPNHRAISPEQLSLGLPVNRERISGRPDDRSNWIFNGSNGSEIHGGMVQATPEMLAMWRNNPIMK